MTPVQNEMTAHQLINQTSGIVEYYTPLEIVQAARECMGEISLDPASSEKANEGVRAGRYFTKEIDGISKRWIACAVWLNHRAALT